jgi:hypothetical protein
MVPLRHSTKGWDKGTLVTVLISSMSITRRFAHLEHPPLCIIGLQLDPVLRGTGIKDKGLMDLIVHQLGCGLQLSRREFG